MQNMNIVEEARTKTLSLYKYLKDLSSLRFRSVLNIKSYDWIYYFKDIPEDTENISISYRDRLKDDELSEDTTFDEILSVKKPEFQKCPDPPKNIIEWLNSGWEYFYNEASVLNLRTHKEIVEKFEDNKARVDDYKKWLYLRKIWQEKQIQIDKTREFFNKLYRLHVDLNRESELFELVIANGFVSIKDDETINHPILLKRVLTEFDAENNIIKICDTETDSELYSGILNDIEDINLSVIKELEEELLEKYYHPLDRHEANDFLKNLIHKLSSKSKFVPFDQEVQVNDDDTLYLKINPVIFKRKRIDGTIKTLQDIILDIENNNSIPAHIVDIVCGGQLELSEENLSEQSIEELLAATSGENSEILLSKEANKEQLEIAKRIEKNNAVCVQGPPGTGKTHTIANLLGHFLAQGKSVLVTSHTPKALKVLKEKVPKGIQNLCVTVLDDRNTDMERSVDGISEYLSKATSQELARKMSDAKIKRQEIINKLSDIRRKIFQIRNLEFEPIVLDGESYSPSKAALFVSENAENLAYIPGKVKLNKLMPLTGEELRILYQSNSEITEDEDLELQLNIPDPKIIFDPSVFLNKVNDYNHYKDEISKLEKSLEIKINYNNNKIFIDYDNMQQVLIENPNINKLNEFLSYVADLGDMEEWMIYAIMDGNKGAGYKERWIKLIEITKDTVQHKESLVADTVGKKFIIPSGFDYNNVLNTLNEINRLFLQKGKLSWFDYNFNNEIKYVLENFKINDKKLSDYNDFILMTEYIDSLKKRDCLKKYWNSLIAERKFKNFDDLDPITNEPERIAFNYIDIIQRCLNWYSNDLVKLQNQLKGMGLNSDILFQDNALDSDLVKTKKYLNFITQELPKYINIIKYFVLIQNIEKEFREVKAILTQGRRQSSSTCNMLIKCVDNFDIDNYNVFYLELSKLFNKNEIRNNRIKLLEKLKIDAPDWAMAIENRTAIHGEHIVPENIYAAWKWKQLAGIIDEITSQPFEELQLESVNLSRELQNRTAQCCEYSAWYHLLKMTETDLDMRQALQGWKTTVKKIGKGTGKNAPKYKREAKKLMAKCQKAVPAWIMPLNRALETLIPGKNLFDIIIIDEASQSDITALSIGYMAKKMIVVGDDKQVSPLAVGIETDKINNLMEMHIKNSIKNWHLYEPRTSLYEIAKTTFQPLMLKEHFRCVPEIIGFSNRLSYDYNIKPLRDSASTIVKPATISLRVDGKRKDDGKINEIEAKYITSLILACMENEKYKNSTFGVISLLGNEQAVYIQNMLLDKMENSLYEHHKILCGDASCFQGDERDIIFLSMIDSNSSEGPLNLAGDGSGDSRKQRYNVAASRAKDQMWLVHSLDITRDLKNGDLRKSLIEYMQNPNNFKQQLDGIRKMADSPFEEEVCKTLVAKGYNITQQWEVGAYRIDMVISYQGKKIALECDGEQFHSGDSKIREDMERQTILERLGWRFIRIRGSEYYRNKEKAIEKIIHKLNDNEIYTEQNIEITHDVEINEEIENLKIRAEQIRNEWELEEKLKQDIIKPQASNICQTSLF